MAKMKPPAGFSLLELLIVLALIALIASSQFQDKQLQARLLIREKLSEKMQLLAETSRHFWLAGANNQSEISRWPRNLEALRQSELLSGHFQNEEVRYSLMVGVRNNQFWVDAQLQLADLSQPQRQGFVADVINKLNGNVVVQPPLTSQLPDQLRLSLLTLIPSAQVASTLDLNRYYLRDGTAPLTGNIPVNGHSIANASVVDTDVLRARSGIFVQSDIRQKKHIAFLDADSVGLWDLTPIQYQMATAPANGSVKTGFSAQQVAALLPSAIWRGDDRQPLALDYMELLAVLWHHVQQLSTDFQTSQNVHSNLLASLAPASSPTNAPPASVNNFPQYNFQPAFSLQGTRYVASFNGTHATVSYRSSAQRNLPSSLACATSNRAVQLADPTDASRAWLIQFGAQPLSPLAQHASNAYLSSHPRAGLLMCFQASQAFIDAVRDWLRPTSRRSYPEPFMRLAQRRQHIVAITPCQFTAAAAANRCPYAPQAEREPTSPPPSPSARPPARPPASPPASPPDSSAPPDTPNPTPDNSEPVVPWRADCGSHRPRLRDCLVPIDLRLSLRSYVQRSEGAATHQKNPYYNISIGTASIGEDSLNLQWYRTQYCYSLQQSCIDLYPIALALALRVTTHNLNLPTQYSELAPTSLTGWQLPFFRRYAQLFPTDTLQAAQNAYKRWLRQPAGRQFQFSRRGFANRAFYYSRKPQSLSYTNDYAQYLPSCSHRSVRHYAECQGYTAN